jgi:hypothetical protein
MPLELELCQELSVARIHGSLWSTLPCIYRISPPKTFERNDPYVATSKLVVRERRGDFSYARYEVWEHQDSHPVNYVVHTPRLYDFFTSDDRGKYTVGEWFKIPKALLLPFTDVPLF